MRTNDGSTNFQALEGMLQIAMSDGGGSDYKRTIGHRFGHSFEFFSTGQHGSGTHSGTCALKGHVVGIDHSQMVKSEIAHRPGGGANVERIARVNKNDAQTVEFSRSEQTIVILRQALGKGLRNARGSRAIVIAAAPLQAIGRRAFLPRRENVKNLSNLRRNAENGSKGCKLHLLWATWGGPTSTATTLENGSESSEVSFMGQMATPISTAKSAEPMNAARPMGRILVVEDDPAVQKALKRLFESEGYAVEIQANGKSALESFQAAPPAVVILDLRLPKLSGSDVCKEIKAQAPTLPIVVLSATSDVSDKVLLLELGADDYVTKPFSPRELLARVRAALRHTSRTASVSLVSFDGISIDFKKMEVQRDGKVVVLTAQEFKTLQFLVQNADRVISRDELLNEVWGYSNYPSTRTVDNHILKLRQKLERDPASPVHFRTVHGMGYKFVR